MRKGEAASAEESRALAAERTLRSEWRIYQPDGSFVPADEFDFGTHQGLKDLFAYEQTGNRTAEEAPPTFEMNFVDTARKAACLSTVQIDVENTERFDITYVTEEGAKAHPLLMHTSISGSLDRNVYAILENQAMRMAYGEKATWPTWLAPIQVRLVPVSNAYLDGVMKLADRIPYRVDVDDRDHKLGRKIRDAEREWIPYVLVVGEKELAGGDLTVRPRVGGQEQLPLEEFLDRLAAETAGKPQRAANTPRSLSRRPIFVG